MGRRILIPGAEGEARREPTRPEPTRRIFFALWPDETLRAAFAHATHKAARASGGRPVPTQNLHATLLFLGSVAESRLAEVKAIGARAAARIPSPTPPGALNFDRIEFWKRARVLVATTSVASGSGHSVASALVGILQHDAIGAGFAPDLKPFRAHVTVARKVARVGETPHMHEVQWPVTGLTLVESVTLAEGPRYDVLDSWAL